MAFLWPSSGFPLAFLWRFRHGRCPDTLVEAPTYRVYHRSRSDGVCWPMARCTHNEPGRQTMVEITNTAEFSAVLDETIAEIDALVVAEPDYRVWGMLQQQLHALKDWSKTTTTPGAERLHAISIGLIAARELEPTNEAWMQDLIDRLHLLHYYWRHWPTGPAPTLTPPSKGARKLTMTVVVLVLLVGGSIVALRSVARAQAGPPIPLGPPTPIPGALATLTSSLEPYVFSLRHNPESERHLIQLKLTDPTKRRPDRLIPIARHMRANALRFDAKLLGDDGQRLWFFVGRIGAWDYRKETLVDADDLRRANPALGTFAPKDNRGDPLISRSVARVAQPARDLWSGEARLYGFDGRLQVTTPDFRGVYAIDPETLRADVK
ncbi:MAG: immunity protein Tsi6 family protein [Gemmatimonadota bacterium]